MILINILISLTWLGIIIFLALLIFACITFAICLATYWLGKIALMMCDWLDRLTKGSLKIAITDDGVTVNAKPTSQVPKLATTVDTKTQKTLEELIKMQKALDAAIKGVYEQIGEINDRLYDLENTAQEKLL